MFGRAFLSVCSGIVVLFGFLLIAAMTVRAQPCIEVDEWDILELPLHYEFSTNFGCKDGVYTCDNLGWEPVLGQTASAYHLRCECENPDPPSARESLTLRSDESSRYYVHRVSPKSRRNACHEVGLDRVL